MLLSRTRDHVVYVRADAQLPGSAIDSAIALAARGGACVAAFVGLQEPGTVSSIRGDAEADAGDVRRAIDVQLPVPRAAQPTLARQQAAAIVLEVLAGPAYRINTQPVAAGNLQRRLREVFSPRPIKILYIRAEAAAAYQDVFHAMDFARAAGVYDIVAAPAGLAIRTTLPDIDLSVRVTERDDAPAERLAGNIGRCRRGDVYAGQAGWPAAAVADADRVYFEFQVERRAQLLPASVVLRYPDMLRAAHVSGDVLAQFVVDSAGRAEPGTFKILESTHDLFTQSVKEALPAMRFVPATVGGKPVRQLVQQPFDFTYTP